MKKLLWIFVPVLMLAACQKYDDTTLKQEIRKLDERVTALETIKTDISGLQTAVQNLQKGFTVSSVKEVSGGWDIVFSDGNKITVKNGNDGASPVIAVRKDTDGKYYWTVNGEWLLDGGAKVPVTGADGAQGPEGPAGKTPQIDIQEGWWVVRFADNEEWKKIAEATSVSGSGSNITVTKDEQFCYITVAGEEPIAIPLTVAAVKIQLVFDESAIAYMSAGETVKIPYTIVAPEGVKTSLETFETPGWIVEIEDGSFSITAPDKIAGGKILFALTSEDGGSFVKIVRILDGEGIATSYSSDATGGTISIPGVTSITIPESVTWITQSTGESGPVLNVAANTGEDRSAEITIVTAAGVTRTIVINQLAAAAIIIAAPDEVAWQGGVLELPVRASVEFTASVTAGSDWLTGLKTKAMTETVYTVNVAQNISVARQGEITVTSSDGTIVQKVAIPQESRFWMDCPLDPEKQASPRNTLPVFNKECTRAYFITRGGTDNLGARRLYEINLEERKVGWMFDMGKADGAAVKSDNGGHICVNPFNGDIICNNQYYVYAVKADGTQRWALKIENTANNCMIIPGCGPGISNDGKTVFFPSRTKKFYAVDAENGSVLDTYDLPTTDNFEYVIYGENEIAFFLNSVKDGIGGLRYLQFTGGKLVEKAVKNAGVGMLDILAPAVSKDQKWAYFGSGNNILALSLTTRDNPNDAGILGWAHNMGGAGCGSIAITPDNHLIESVAGVQGANAKPATVYFANLNTPYTNDSWFVSSNLKVGANQLNFSGVTCDESSNAYIFHSATKGLYKISPNGNYVQLADIATAYSEYQAASGFGGNYYIIGGGKLNQENRIIVLKMEAPRAKGWSGPGGDVCMTKNANLVWGN